MKHRICTIPGTPVRRKAGLEPLALGILAAAFLTLSLYIPLSYANQFKVTRVYDGDTVKAEGHDIKIKIRLVGIDAPETSGRKHEEGHPFSQRATKHLAGLVLNKVGDVKGYGMDRYNRMLGVLFMDGMKVNLEMVISGFEELYDGWPQGGFVIGTWSDVNPGGQISRPHRVEKDAEGGVNGVRPTMGYWGKSEMGLSKEESPLRTQVEHVF